MKNPPAQASESELGSQTTLENSRRNETLTLLLISFLLAGLVWAVFGQTLSYGFVNYDDNEYVYENQHIANGLSLDSIGWALTNSYSANWHPLTAISQMLDCQIYGLHPWGHHLTNVLLHSLAAVALFFALRRLTGATWPSAFVAALFAVHPLRVESVAWISERKDVLSGLFFALTLWSYAVYVYGSKTKRLSYFAVIFFFTLGLLSKPSLVTLPFVLLLLDYWPLRRVSQGANTDWRPLISEKFPLFILSGLSCVATLLAQSEALEGTRPLGLIDRASNALLSYATYLGQFFYPAHLAVIYPFSTSIAVISQLLPSFLLLAVGTAAFFLCRKRYPFLLVGWLWFLGMLVPMIGLVQVGSQAHADRYTYLSQIGLALLLTWGAVALLGQSRNGRLILGSLGVLIVSALTVLSFQETGHWRNTEQLWRHALADTKNNYIAHNNLGQPLTENGRFAEAISHFRQAIALKPDYAEAYNNLGNALLGSDEVARRQKPVDLEHPENNTPPNETALNEAIENYRSALKAKPDFAQGWTNLATALLQKGERAEAIADYEKALEFSPDLPEANGNFANALLEQGNLDESMKFYRRALELKPDYADAHYGLGKALLQTNRTEEASEHLQKVIALQSDYPEAWHNLGVIFAQKGNLGSAVSYYRKALQLRPNYAQAESNLGNALLRNGEIDEAILHLQSALRLTPSYADAANDLGSALMRKGQLGEAVAAYEKAVQLRPNYAEAHSNLGNAYLQKKEIDKAIAQDKAAAYFNPQSAAVQLNLGNALSGKGDFAEAIKCYEAALRLEPDRVEVHNQLGVAFAAVQRNDDALDEFTRALELNSRYVFAHYNLGRLLAKLGRRSEAISHLTEAVRLKPDYADAKRQLAELGGPPAN